MKLEHVKVGDPIAVREHGFITKRKVEWETTFRVCTKSMCFSRKTGLLIDGGFACASAEPWVTETEAEAALQPLRRVLANYPWRSATKQQAEAVLAVMKAQGMPTAGC